MKRSLLYVLIALALGIAGFLLRGFSLALEYDAATNLIRRGAPLGITLVIFCVLAGVALYFLNPKEKPRRKSAMPMLYLFLDLPAAAALAVSGVLMMVRYAGNSTYDSGRLALLVMSVLTIFTALCIAIVALRLPKGAVPSAYGFYLAVPVIWACINLFGDFFEHSGNPVLSDYAYILLSYVAVTLALFGACSRFYLGRVSSRIMPFYASLGVMLSMIALAGPVLAKWILGDGAALPRAISIPATRQFILLFILLHSLALLWLSARNALDGNFTPKYKEADAPQPDVSADIDIVLGLDETVQPEESENAALEQDLPCEPTSEPQE